MKTLKRSFARLLNLLTRSRAGERLQEEIASHLAAQAEENIRSGMTPEQAHRQARIKFGPLEAIRQDYQTEASLPFVEHLLLDTRYALRVLRNSPGFTFVALLTLALGIGVNIVVFGVLNAVLLHPLDVRDPPSLYQVRHQAWMTGRLITTSYPTFEDFQRRNKTFTGITAINAYSTARLSWRNTVKNVQGDQVTGNYFDLLGVQPQVGRFFHQADEHGPGSAPYLVLSDALWRSAFQADPALVGATVELNQHPFTVIGIATPQFHGVERFVSPDYWMPMLNEEQVDGYDDLHNRAALSCTLIGRLKPGVTPRQAAEDLSTISAQLAQEYPRTEDGLPLRLIHPGLIGDEGDVIRGFLYSVTMLALLVLAAACANLASLSAARAADRSRELAVRVALGSSRLRLVRQLLTEALLLSLFGGAAGFLSAHLLLGVLNRWPPALEAHLDANVDTRVFLIALALTLGSALLFGIVPARHAWQSSPLQTMKNGPADFPRLRRFALRDILLGVQIAICTLLVTASLVAARGMVQALHTPLGFQPQGALLAGVDLAQPRQVIEAVQRIPGVTAAGTVNRSPMTGGLHGIPVYWPGTTEFTMKNYAQAPYVFSLSPGYLEAAGTRLLGGRDFSWHDTADTPYVAIVNATFAHRMWGQTRAIGQRFVLSGHLTEVVGVSEDGKYHDLTESPHPALYVPFSQSQQDQEVLVVRSHRPPNEMTAALQRTFNAIQPGAPLTLQSWPDALASELFPARAATVALGVMGLLAALLAVTGISGMAAYSVSRRTRELGIRVALGARKYQVMVSAVGRPILLLAVGSALGLLSGIFASRLLGNIVYQANPHDPIVLAGTLLTMALLGVAASTLPARRALVVDPSKLMREE